MCSTLSKGVRFSLVQHPIQECDILVLHGVRPVILLCGTMLTHGAVERATRHQNSTTFHAKNDATLCGVTPKSLAQVRAVADGASATAAFAVAVYGTKSALYYSCQAQHRLPASLDMLTGS